MSALHHHFLNIDQNDSKTIQKYKLVGLKKENSKTGKQM